MFRVHTLSSGALDVVLQHMVFCNEFLDGWWSWELLHRLCVRCGWCRVTSAPYTRPTQWLSRPPPIQKLVAENHMLQHNIQCSWWWVYVPETCRAKNILIKLPSCIKLAFQVNTSILFEGQKERLARIIQLSDSAHNSYSFGFAVCDSCHTWSCLCVFKF